MRRRVLPCRALEPRAPRPLATLALVTFVVLVLELTATRLFAYVGSAHATSTALSIALLGLGLGAFARLRGAPPAVAEVALPAALLALAGAAVGGAPLPVLGGLLLVTVALAGALASDAYAARGAEAARATYAVDLFAAAAGCLVAPRLIGPLAPTEILAGLGILAGGRAVLVGARRPRTRAALGLVVAAHGALLVASRAGALPDGPLAVMLAAPAGSEKAIVEAPTSAANVVDAAWSPLGRLDVHRRPGEPDRLGVFTDGMSPTYMVEEARIRDGAFERTWGAFLAVPYRALAPARVLVLAAGAGASVWLAKAHGAARVDAVEVNPALPGVLARWRAFAGDVYGQPGVRLIIEDARRFLADTRERYDLIELALALTGNAHAQAAGMEAHMYTVEAVVLYLRHLTPTGALVLVHSDPGNAYRQLLTVLDALAALGIPRARALDGIVVLHDPRPATAYRYMLVVRTSPVPLEIVDALDAAPAELLWAAGDPPERAAALLDPAQLGATARDDLRPVHDDRPYFFLNTRGVVATALAQPGRLWGLAGAVALLVVLLLARGADAERAARPALAAIGLGVAFFAVELALIQRLTLAAGGALHAVSFVLFGLLAWSGAGALLLGRWWRRRDRGVALACVVAALAVGVTAALVRDLAWLEGLPGVGARLLLISALLAPVGLALGGPFPTLLAHHGAPAARVARLWAINGAASVAGGVLAVLALQVAGATLTLLLAAGLYVITAALAPARATSRT